MRYLCFDIGDKRTGIAFGTDTTNIASPVGMIEASIKGPLLDRIMLVIDEHEPDMIILGLPLNMDGTHGDRAKVVAAFSERISAAVDLPIHLHDERLSTFAADEMMSQSGLTHKQKKARRDALAAVAILRDFLNHEPDFRRPDQDAELNREASAD